MDIYYKEISTIRNTLKGLRQTVFASLCPGLIVNFSPPEVAALELMVNPNMTYGLSNQDRKTDISSRKIDLEENKTHFKSPRWQFSTPVQLTSGFPSFI